MLVTKWSPLQILSKTAVIRKGYMKLRLFEVLNSVFVKEFKIDNFSTHIFNDANVEKGILNFTRSINADLIGIGTHGRKGIAHFFNGSISEDLVNHALRPVVTFKI